MSNRIWIALCIFFTILATIFAQRNIGGRLQSINLEEVIKNDRLFNNFYKCLTDEGRCTNDAKSVKSLIPEVVKTKCGQCTDADRLQIKTAINLLLKNKPKEFDTITAKYDPQGVWKELAQ